MKQSLALMVVALIAFVALATGTGAALSRHMLVAPLVIAPARILYISGTHLWVRSVDSGPARQVATPWPMARTGGIVGGFRWSPDGQRAAVDDGRGRLGIVNLVTSRMTVLLGQRCSGNCSSSVYTWSPNSRYLAFVQVPSTGQRAVLKMWDSATGTTRVLISNASAYTASPEWSHDSARIAVATGRFDTIKNVYPDLVTVSLSGLVVRLGKGTDARWSPDDRLLGIIRPNFCGANTCDEDVVIEDSRGGPPIVLKRHSTSLFDDPIWSPKTQPYTFDRWQLGPSGHLQRRVAGPRELLLSWNPAGTRLALQTYYPYQSNPDSLYLATPSGTRTRLYTDGRNQGCGACSKDVYSVVWGHTGLMAWTTPTYPTPKNVTVPSMLFVSSMNGGTPVQVPVPAANLVSILGFADNDRVLVIHAGKTIYAYQPSTRSLTPLVRGVSNQYATVVLEPTAP